VIDWLSKTPPEEAAAIARIPGADKVKIVNGLTKEAIAAARGGKLVQLSREAKALLGSPAVAAIMAAGAANVNTAGQAKERMRALQPSAAQ
jgi:hypothetical protein